MNMAVEDGLPGRLACIHANVKTNHSIIRTRYLMAHFLEEPVTGIDLGSAQSEVINDVALGNHEGMEFGNRETIPDRVRELVFGDQPFSGCLAEETVTLPMPVRFNDLVEIRVVAVPLHGIAAVAEGLKVVDVVGAAPISRRDMVNLQGLEIG